MNADSPLWLQFRRLLLGTLVEVLGDQGVDVELSSIDIQFSPESAFRVPRLNNYMRFVGTVEAELDHDLDANGLAALDVALARIWPEVLAVVILPIGDALTEEKNEVSVALDGRALTIRFDLVAD